MDSQYLTLDFEQQGGGAQTVVLQYHPNSLSLEQSSGSTTMVGLHNLITHISKPKTAISSINIQATITALDARTKNVSLAADELGYFLAGAGGNTLLGIQGDVFNITQSLTNIISVTKGTIDLVSGLIQSTTQIKKRITFNEQQLDYIRVLREANANTTPCKINWDVETASIQDERKYFIKSLGINVLDIQEESGATLAFNLDLTFQQYGTQNVEI